MIYRMLLVILTLGFAVSYCASAVVKGPSPPRPATLYASVPLNDSIPIAFTAKNKEWSRISAAVLKCSGLTELYYGRQLETSNLDLIIAFASSSAATSCQSAFVSAMQPFLALPITSYVVILQAPLPTLTNAPVTEVALFWLPTNANQAQISSFKSAFASLAAAVKQAEGEVYLASGDVQGLVLNSSGERTSAVLAYVGWQSVAAHGAFTTTTSFIDAIARLSPTVSGLADHHVILSKCF